ncbi:unnamed protein product [Cladocopium goreaui]|uniref:Uncharacterized protein n=1 Tax=Cladocopium goreaui TaxID=2562237 RepID=A0A9P1CIR4_9DINO|nr:unnamed protein product [Cladocopium goreaui]
MKAKLCNVIEAITADGAADEQLALATMAGNTDGQDAIFPNIRLQCRDLCHAVRRVGQRPSFADPFLKETLALFLDGPAKMIQHSVLFKD